MTETDPRTTRSRADNARARLLDAMLGEAAFDGWNDAALARAAATAGLSEGEVQLYCPDGVLDLLEIWSRTADEAAAEAIRQNGANRIRDKITEAVMIRLAELNGEEDAADRARARLLLPDGAARGVQLLWATSDMIWRAIGDTSTDANFYSKRAILSGVYASTFSVWLDDASEDKAKTRAFLDRRIENVMQFEKVKAQASKATASMPDLVGLAARLRHGLGRRV
ncbi:MAG: COQ9 family protein [Pseudomonadota bacterium]